MLYLAGISISLFLALLVFTKRNKSHADSVLACWMTLMGIHLTVHYMYSSGKYVLCPEVVTIGFALPLLHGPFLYVYTLLQTTPAKFKGNYLLHLSPALISLLLFSQFYMMSTEEKLQVLETKGEQFQVQLLINLCLTILSGIIYITLSWVQLMRYRNNMVHQFSNTEKINFNWLLYLILWMIVIWFIIIFIRGDVLVFGTVSIFILWLGYFGIKQVPVFHQHVAATIPDIKESTDQPVQDPEPPIVNDSIPDVVETVKYQKSNLTDASVDEIHERLKLLMEVVKPYKNPDLTLNELAKLLAVQPNHLSQVINSKEKKNFYDLVNAHRSAEFIRMVSDNSNQQYTLLGIALECGFNSKASFNRNFKKYTGLAPRDYLKKVNIPE